MSGKVKVGVVGVGSLGFHHARLLRELAGVTLVGIHDVDPARLGEVGAALGAPTYATADDLFARVDAVVVAVPTAAHEWVARAALDRGVHVLIEKPIAPTLEAADRILEAATATGALVQIGHVERFNGALRACESYLHEPLFVESHRLAPFGPRGTEVAVVLDLMIHDLDLVLSLVRRPVTHVAAVGVPVLTSSPDIASARLDFSGGAVANLTASRVSLERVRKIRFFQRSGYISLDLARGTGEFLRLRTELAWEERMAGPSAPAPPLPAGRLEDIVERVPLEADPVEPLQCELERFVDAVLGRTPVAVTGEDGRDALAVALEIIDRIDRHVAHTRTA